MDCGREVLGRPEGDDDGCAGEFPALLGENVILGDDLMSEGGPNAEGPWPLVGLPRRCGWMVAAR